MSGYQVEGGPGNDTLRGTYVEGDDGDDEIHTHGAVLDVRNALGPMVVDLRAGTATGQGADTFSGIQYVWGSRYNDVISGDDEANSLYGYRGNDTLLGRGGNDYLKGLFGVDTVSGGAGSDRCQGETTKGCEGPA